MKIKRFLLNFLIFFFLLIPSYALSQCETTIDGYCRADVDIVAYDGIITPSVSNSGQATMYFDQSLGVLRCSEDGGAYENCIGSSTGLTDPMTTRGDVIIRDSTNTTARLGVGANGEALVSDGTDISWGTAGGGATSLTGLSDVSSATVTAGRLLVADGAAWQSVDTVYVDSNGIGNNVGIGTTAPAYRLDVNGSIKTNDKFYGDYWVSSTGNSMNIQPTGDADDFFSFKTPADRPTIKREGGKYIYVESSNVNDVGISFRKDADHSGTINYYKDTEEFGLTSKDPLVFKVCEDYDDYVKICAASDVPELSTVGAADFKINAGGANNLLLNHSGGNVGIGNTDPTYLLDTAEIGNSGGDLKIQADVEGDVVLFGDTDVGDATSGNTLYIIRKAAEGDASGNLYVDAGNTFQFITQDANAAFNVSSGKRIYFNDLGNATTLRFGSSWQGSVNPTLEYYGYITADTSNKYIQLQINDTTDNFELTREDAYIQNFDIQIPTIITQQATEDAFQIIGSDASQDFIVKGDGNVGIGTTNPTQKLEVNGNLKVGDYYFPTADGTADQILTTNGSGVLAWNAQTGGGAASLTGLSDVSSATATAGRLLVSNGTSWDSVDTVFVDSSSGNVGIGTTAVTSKLVVDGSISSTSGSGTIIITGVDANDNDANKLLIADGTDYNPRTFNDLTDVTSTDTDYIIIADQSDSWNLKKVDMSEVRGTGGGASSLTGLTDVSSATATNGRLLVANGSTWDSIDTLYVDEASGNVGVGTTAPSETFHVVGSGYFEGSGNVGIGTTAPAGKLEVDGVIIPDKVTADPCSAGEEGGIFWNTTSNYLCVCDGTNDVKVSDGTTACF